MRAALELLAIVFLRFRPLPRAWASLLVLVNLGAVWFLDTIYGQVALAAVVAGIATSAASGMPAAALTTRIRIIAERLP